MADAAAKDREYWEETVKAAAAGQSETAFVAVQEGEAVGMVRGC